MNIDRRPAPISVLCFGDSNTWGYVPGDGSRYPSDVRWTGILQRLLDEGFHVIEEGLNGRTTNADYRHRPGRNGRAYFASCMDSHCAVDWLILMLGTNDTKAEFQRSPEMIASGMEELVRVAKGEGLENPSPDVKILLAAPPEIKEGIGRFKEQLTGAGPKSAALVPLYQEIAARHGLRFVDLFHEVAPSLIDGVHLSEDAHARVAELFAKIISEGRQNY